MLCAKRELSMVMRSTGSLKKKLGDVLVEVGILTREQLDNALEVQRTRGGKLGDILKELKFCSEDVLLAFLGRQCGVSYVSLSEYGEIPPHVISLVPESMAREHRLIPLRREDESLTVAMSDPLNVFATDDLETLTRLRVKVVVASEGEIQRAVEKYYGKAGGTHGPPPAAKAPLPRPTETAVPAAPRAVSMEDRIGAFVAEAVRTGTTDLHLELFESRLRVRARTQGTLRTLPAIPEKEAEAFVQKLKALAGLNTADKAKAQEGWLKADISGRSLQARVFCTPMAAGEKLVIRFPEAARPLPALSELGLDPSSLSLLKKWLGSGQGLILIAGPAGAGKTTTFHSALAALNREDMSIAAWEDPMERKLDGVTQVRARLSRREVQCLDADVFGIGEISDAETTATAVETAAFRLVLATLRAEGREEVLARFAQWGISSSAFAACLLGVVFQRRLRRLCEGCKEPREIPARQLLSYGFKENNLRQSFRSIGCAQCRGTGFQGSVVLFKFWEDFKKSESEMESFRKAVVKNLQEGTVSWEEALRAAPLSNNSRLGKKR
jgi:type IV pilus assembly protein PilB